VSTTLVSLSLLSIVTPASTPRSFTTTPSAPSSGHCILVKSITDVRREGLQRVSKASKTTLELEAAAWSNHDAVASAASHSIRRSSLMAMYSMVIAISILEPVPTARGMAGEPSKIDTKLS
jgi:hypothetical protein